jgi:hypothetical protein
VWSERPHRYSFAQGAWLADGYYHAFARPASRRRQLSCTIPPIGARRRPCEPSDMTERRYVELGAARRGSPLRAPERDPANELYDQACSLLEAAQGVRAAASSWRSAPALAPALGCIEESLRELRDAVPELRDTAMTTPANGRSGRGPTRREPLQIRAEFALLARDLSASRSSCAAVRRLVGPALAKR